MRRRSPAAFARSGPDEIWRALQLTMDRFAEVDRRMAEALRLPYSRDAEERARRLVAAYAPRRA